MKHWFQHHLEKNLNFNMQDNTQTQETVEFEVSQEQLINESLSNPDVQQKLDIFATHIAEVSHNNWITVDQMIKKSRIKNRTELLTFLDLLVFTRKAFVKKDKEVVKYKITLSIEMRKKVLSTQITDLKNMVKILEEELISIS